MQHHGAIGKRNHRFWNVDGQRPQPGAKPTCEDDSFHEDTPMEWYSARYSCALACHEKSQPMPIA